MMTTIYDHINKGIGLAVMLLTLTLWSSCVENQVTPNAKQSPAKRQAQAIDSLRALLKSSEYGWKLAYKPDKQTGVYDFLFKFLKDSIVETRTDFSPKDTVIQKSEYAITWGSTVKLSFVTNGPLHRLADSNISPLADKGSGLKGSFEFLYYGKSANGEDLIFRTERNQENLIFKKATKKTKAQYLDTLKADAKNLARLINNLKGGLFEPSINYTISGTTTKSSIALANDYRTLTLRSVTKAADGKGGVKFSWGTSYTTLMGLNYSSIRIDKLKIGKREIKNLNMVYNTAEKKYKATLASGAVLEITANHVPLITYDGYKELLGTKYSTQYISIAKTNGILHLVSPAAKPTVDAYFASGLTRLSLYFRLNGGPFSITWILPERERQTLVYRVTNERLIIRASRAPALSTPARQAAYRNFMKLLTDPKGFYVENAGGGMSTVYNNEVFILISAKDPKIKIPFMKYSRN